MNDKISKIKSYEDACKDQGITPLTINDFASLPKEEQQAFFSLHKISTVRKSLNGDWKADYLNYDQRKFYPYFYNQSGVGFSFVDYYCDFTRIRVSVPAFLIAIEKRQFMRANSL